MKDFQRDILTRTQVLLPEIDLTNFFYHLLNRVVWGTLKIKVLISEKQKEHN